MCACVHVCACASVCVCVCEQLGFVHKMKMQIYCHVNYAGVVIQMEQFVSVHNSGGWRSR